MLDNDSLSKIKLIAMDVDGTMTDGKLYVDEERNNLKAFDVKDGFGIANWIKSGGLVAIITGKDSNIVKRRAEELGVQYICQGVKNKSDALKQILIIEKLTLFNVCYIGDDINDYGIMKKVKFSCAPKDASEEIIEIADMICTHVGGNGAVREVIETIMKANKTWDKIIEKYKNE